MDKYHPWIDAITDLSAPSSDQKINIADTPPYRNSAASVRIVVL